MFSNVLIGGRGGGVTPGLAPNMFEIARTLVKNLDMLQESWPQPYS